MKTIYRIKEEMAVRRLASFQTVFSSSNSGDSTWVICLSDLMSLLLIFFLVWTALKVAHLQRANEILNDVPKMSFKFKKQDLLGLKDTLMEFSPLDTSDGSIVIVLQEDFTFSSSSATLSDNGKRAIHRIAGVLKNGLHYRIKVIGHTDALPISGKSKWSSNMELSIARAAAVGTELIAEGIAPERILMQGLGALYPVHRGVDSSFRKFNRRVELVIEPVS